MPDAPLHLPGLTLAPTWRVANPLPFARWALAILPPSDATAVSDNRGRRYPLQAGRGVGGDANCVVALALGAGEVVELTPIIDPAAKPVAGAQWEVSKSVLDNGRVRAEFGGSDRLERCCFDGRFVALVGPGFDVQGSVVSPMQVINRGPAFARLGKTWGTTEGPATMQISLMAHDDLLLFEIAAHSGVAITLSTTHELNVNTRAGMTVISGDDGRRGVAILAEAGDRVNVANGTVRLLGRDRGPTTIAMTRAQRLPDTNSLWLSAFAAMSTPVTVAEPPRPPLWRWTDLDGVVPVAEAAPKDWDGALTLHECANRAARVGWWPQRPLVVAMVQADGSETALQAQDGSFALDLAPLTTLTLHWRFA